MLLARSIRKASEPRIAFSPGKQHHVHQIVNGTVAKLMENERA